MTTTEFKPIHKLLEESISAKIEKELPKFAEMVKLAKEKGNATVLIHQDAFALNYEDTELDLLGMAIKYCGIHGVAITVTGTNREHVVREKLLKPKE